MLLQLAVGDAYGAGFEYVDAGIVDAHNDGMHYHKHPRHEAPVGWHTDDTQMSLAIAEAIVSGGEWTPLMLANRFVEVFHRDPRTGYARGFHALLSRVGSGQELLDLILPDSDKSGAAMRAAPLGVFPTVAEVIEKTTVQARVTHDTPDGIRAACAAALMTHYFLYGHGLKADLGCFLESYVAGNWSEPWRGKVKSKGWMSTHAACTAVMSHDRMSDLLRACVAFTGDVDTVAAIALAAGACCTEMVQDLPDTLVWQLENRTYGRDYVIALGKQLLALFIRETEVRTMPIYFYREREKPYGCFSNFSPHGFDLDGKHWQTSEHYFQAQKFAGTPHEEAVRLAPRPMDAANLGRDRSLPLRPDWDQVKDNAMRRAVRAKFETHADIREILLGTGDEELVEETTQDTYWGCGTDRTGKNMLGKILMESREISRRG